MKKIAQKKIQEDISNTIVQIESKSNVEIVALLYPYCGHYREVPLLWGLAFSFLAFVFLMFSPIVFSDYLIFGGPVAAFIFGVFLATFIKPLKRILVSDKRMRKNLELKARSVFQKSELHQTKERTGMLLLFSEFEKMVYILPDTGVFVKIPENEIEELEINLDDAIKGRNKGEAICSVLNSRKDLFSKYIPKSDDDTDELPNFIDANI